MPGNWHVRFGGADPGNRPAKADTAPGFDPNHHAGWRVEPHPDGRLTWITPTGHRHTTEPHDYRPDPPPPAADDPDPPPF